MLIIGGSCRKFRGAIGIHKWYFVILWIQIELWGHSNPTCCNFKIHLNVLPSQVAGKLKHHSHTLRTSRAPSARANLVKLSQHLINSWKYDVSHPHRVLVNSSRAAAPRGEGALNWLYCQWKHLLNRVSVLTAAAGAFRDGNQRSYLSPVCAFTY